MRLLRINNVDVDIDEKTAIGVNLQSYDIKTPGKRFVNVTNTFTIPPTSKNLGVFGNAQNSQSISTDIYAKATCDYWVDNERLIRNAKCRVDKINERISIFIFQKKDVWEELDEVLWPDFIEAFIDWLTGLPTQSNPFTGQSNAFIQTYATNTEGVFLPMYFGNMYNYDPDEDGIFVEDETNIYLKYFSVTPAEIAWGGHFCIYVKTIFKYIEDVFNVNFLTSGGILPGNIWDDAIAPNIYVAARDIGIDFSGTPAASTIYFRPRFATAEKFHPLKDQADQGDKTLLDFVNSFMQHFNILKDELLVDGEEVIRMARFDDMETIAEVVDWSDRFAGIQTFKPLIPGYGQNNIVKFKGIFPEGDSLVNSKTLTSLNKNTDITKTLFEIDSYVSAFLPVTGGVVPDLSPKEAFKTFVFMISDGLTDDNINVNITDSAENPIILANRQLSKAALYDLDSEYNFLNQAITHPRFYEAKRWLTLGDVKDFEFFKQYFIRELNGSFFVNKISGFNPQKSKEPTKIELIKVSDRTPVVPPNLDFWVDGVVDAWFDGEDDWLF